MSVSRRLAVVATALGLVSAGLVTGASANTASQTTASEPGQAVNVVVKRDHTVVMPATIQPGVTGFTVASRREVSFQLIQPRKGYTKRHFVRDANRLFRSSSVRPLKSLERGTVLHGGVNAGPGKPGSMAVDLAAGTYWVADVSPARLRARNVKTLTVTGDSVGGSLSGQVIRAVDEVKWGKVTPRITRKGTILFENRSTENHFLEIGKLKKGKTLKDFRRWVNQAKKGKQVPPPLVENVGAGTGVVGPGRTMSFDYRLPAGDYVLICFWPDAEMGGMPHVFMGMYRALKVG